VLFDVESRRIDEVGRVCPSQDGGCPQACAAPCCTRERAGRSATSRSFERLIHRRGSRGLGSWPNEPRHWSACLGHGAHRGVGARGGEWPFERRSWSWSVCSRVVIKHLLRHAFVLHLGLVHGNRLGERTGFNEPRGAVVGITLENLCAQGLCRSRGHMQRHAMCTLSQWFDELLRADGVICESKLCKANDRLTSR
jgi:hypothetical protein